jgi:hypothetical protein
MSVTKETLPIEGVLKGQGHERTCRVRATRCSTYPDEGTEPVSVSYSRCRIEDADDFPDGNYELVFDGHKKFLTKKTGRYLLLDSWRFRQ